MSDSEYFKIFEGNFILAQRIVNELNAIGINPIVKDESESQRLAGYASLNQGFQEIIVHKDEFDKAKGIVDRINLEMQS